MESIIFNIISDFIFIGLLAFFSYLYFRLSARNSLMKFFGIEKSKRIPIYISRIRVIRGGSKGIDGKTRSYNGVAVANGEMEAARSIQQLFNLAFLTITEIPEFLRKVFITDIDAPIIVSPINQNELEKTSTYITLGSPAYNLASSNFEKNFSEEIVFRLGIQNESRDEMGKIFVTTTDKSTEATVSVYGLRESQGNSGPAIADNEFTSGSSVGLEDQNRNPIKSAIIVKGVGEFTNPFVGCIIKAYDKENYRWIFIAMGLSEYSTAASAMYLQKKWRDLYKKYDVNNGFFEFIQFAENDQMKWTYLFGKQLE